MAETNITTLAHSENIHIFPVAKIRIEQRSRILYEDNVSNIIRQIIDTNGFVIPDDADNLTIFDEYVDSTNGVTCVGIYKDTDDQGNIITDPFRIKFNIYGYYVEINNTILPVNKYTKVFAKLSITKDFPQEISGQDVTDSEGTTVYEGIKLIATDEELKDSEDTKYRYIYLKLLERFNDGDTNRWRVPLQSYGRFDLRRLITGIDGKTEGVQ